MRKKLAEFDNIIPSPETVELKSPIFEPRNSIKKVAIRRSKVKELMKMGYSANHMALILSKGITIAKGEKVEVPASKKIIESDMTYIRQELASEDIDFQEKRVDIIEKLRYLYNQAIIESKDAKGSIRNSFLNTALSVLNKLMDIEGFKSPDNLLNVNLSAEAKIAKFSVEVQKLSKDDKSTILTAIRKVREQRKPKGIGDTGVSGKPSRIPAQTSNDEGVSRKS